MNASVSSLPAKRSDPKGAGTDEGRKPYQRRLAALKLERSSFEGHWRDLSDYLAPRRGRFLVSDRNKDRRSPKIINPAGRLAARTLANGMMGGVTSPARPWFKLSTPDPELAEHGEVKMWLDDATKMMRQVFARSNFYNCIHTLYGEIGTFGTASMLIDEDYDDVIRCYPFSVGEYYLANSHRLDVNTLYRECSYTVSQLVEMFGLDAVSTRVRDAFDRGYYDQWVEVAHAIEANPSHIAGRAGPDGKPFRSVYYEVAGETDKLLHRGGYNEWPAPSPRWDLLAGDIYGSSPGMDALPDVKALQIMEMRKAQGIDKMVNPPMQAPADLKNQPVSSLPGGISYYNGQAGAAGIKPLYEVQPRLAELMGSMQEHEQRIQQAFFADLFLMMAQSDRREITAREIDERHEEKLLQLGPVLERLHDELLNPVIDRVFAIMTRNGILPEPPPDLEGVDLKVEYVGLLAQAQQAVAVGSIERFAGFVGNLAAVNPAALDKMDFDQAIDEYGQAVGVAASLVIPDETVMKIRAERQRAAQAQQQAAMMQQAAEGAKTLSEVDTGSGGNLLANILGGPGGSV
jgi:hypothetical protein